VYSLAVGRSRQVLCSVSAKEVALSVQHGIHDSLSYQSSFHQLPDRCRHGRCGRFYSFSACGWLSDPSRVMREGSVVSVPSLGVSCVCWVP